MSNFDAFKKKDCRKLIVSNLRADSPRVVPEKEALRLIKRNNMTLFEISAQNLTEVDEVFINIASQMYYRSRAQIFDICDNSLSRMSYVKKKKNRRRFR